MSEFENWQKLVSRKAAVLPAQNVIMGYTRADFKSLLKIDCGFSRFCYINFGVYVLKKEFFSFATKTQAKVKKDPGFIEWVIKENNKQCDRLLKAADINGIDLGKKSNRSLRLLLQRYIKEFYNMGPFWVVPFAIEKIGTGIILKELERKLRENKALIKDYFLILTSPSKESYVAQERREFLQLAKEILEAGYLLKDKKLKIKLRKNKVIWAKIKSHLSKYCWLNIQFMIGRPWIANDLILRFKEVDNPESGLKKLSARNQANEKAAIELIRKLNFSNRLKKIIAAVREYVFLRTHRKDITTMTDYKIRPLLIEIAKRHNLTFKNIIYYTSEEIYLLLKTGQKVADSVIKSRRRDFAILATKRTAKVLVDKELVGYRESWGKEEIEKNIKKIIGVTASKGYSKGKVRVLIDKRQIRIFKKGEVLVTTMTTPDFVPAMRKAAAIITDEGGILCHAAIVSREFGIPCVIATKTATTVLKDGDLVEVDADGGLIRIL